MSDPSRVRRRAATLVLALVAAACGDDASPTTASTASTAATSSTTSATTGSTSTAVDDGTVIEIAIEGGSVVGGAQRHEVTLGESVTLRVTSDVADEVHVHTYDLTVDVAPGADGVLTFDAAIPGVFEVELEQRGLKIAELEVA